MLLADDCDCGVIDMRAANFKHSLWPVDVDVCMYSCIVSMSASFRLNISETNRESELSPIGSL